MSEELEVLRIVTGRLSDANIPYMITGSMAMNFYAMPRMTRDIDLVVELSKPDINRVMQQFQSDFYVDREMIQEAVNQTTMFNIIHTDYVIKVDFVIRKNSPFRRLEFSRRRHVIVEGFSLAIVTPEDLILSKLEWAKDTKSENQLRDIQNLLATVDGLDRNYLNEWASQLGVEPLYREVGK